MSYHASRRAAALPRWREIDRLRKQGMKYKDIATAIGAPSLHAVFKAHTKLGALGSKMIAC